MKPELNKKRLFYIAAIHKWEESEAAVRHVLEVCRQFSAQGINVHLFIPRTGKNISIKPEELKIIQIPVLRVHPVLMSISFQFALIFKLWPVLKKESKPLFYGRHSFLDCFTLLPLRLFFKFTYVSEINGIRSLESNASRTGKKFISFLERCSLNRYTKAVAVTKEIRNWAEKYCGQVVDIPNGVNTAFFKPLDKKKAQTALGLDSKKRYINFTGSLKSWHGTETVINALPLIISKIPEVILFVIGDGPEKENLKMLSKKIGIDSSIIWAGKVSKDMVVTYLGASDLCLAPINNDSVMKIGRSSLKIFEYMACGKPFVTTRIGKSYDALIENSGAGILVNGVEPGLVAEAVINLLTDKKKADEMGQSGRKFVEKKYSWYIISRKIAGFIWQS